MGADPVLVPEQATLDAHGDGDGDDALAGAEDQLQGIVGVTGTAAAVEVATPEVDDLAPSVVDGDRRRRRRRTKAIPDVAKQGEDHAVSEFDKALDQDISADLLAVVQRQATGITAARESIANLMAAHS